MGKRVVVIGAGIVGASIAWHLAQEGLDVVVIDAGSGGGVATPNSFSWINASWGNPESYVRFRRRSMARWRQLRDAVPGLGLNMSGSLLWDLTPERLTAYADEHRSWGYDLRWVGPDDMTRIEPGLTNAPAKALHCPDEGSIEPVDAARALLSASGCAVLLDTRVSALIVSGNRVAGVATGAGAVIDADEVVIAAGAETTNLLAPLSIALNMTATAGLIAHSTIAPIRLLNGLLLSPQCHVRQTREGRVIVGADFGGEDPGDRPEAAATELLERAKALIGGSEALKLDFFTIGHRPTPADGLPAVGRPKGIEGLTVAVMHSGVTLAPVVGELIASEITTGRTHPDLDAYDPNRSALRASSHALPA